MKLLKTQAGLSQHSFFTDVPCTKTETQTLSFAFIMMSLYALSIPYKDEGKMTANGSKKVI